MSASSEMVLGSYCQNPANPWVCLWWSCVLCLQAPGCASMWPCVLVSSECSCVTMSFICDSSRTSTMSIQMFLHPWAIRCRLWRKGYCHVNKFFPTLPVCVCSSLPDWLSMCCACCSLFPFPCVFKPFIHSSHYQIVSLLSIIIPAFSWCVLHVIQMVFLDV